jgi:hypothetical protein
MGTGSNRETDVVGLAKLGPLLEDKGEHQPNQSPRKREGVACHALEMEDVGLVHEAGRDGGSPHTMCSLTGRTVTFCSWP